MTHYTLVEYEPNVFYTMLTLPISESLAVVHCIDNKDTTIFTESDEFELKWNRDIFELVAHLVNVPLSNILEAIQQLQLKEKQMLS